MRMRALESERPVLADCVEKVVEQHPVAAITTENKAAGNDFIGSMLTDMFTDLVGCLLS